MNDKKCITIPVDVLKANFDRKGYFDRVNFHASNNVTYADAWRKTETELAAYCLPCRYSSYKSFIRNRITFVNQTTK